MKQAWLTAAVLPLLATPAVADDFLCQSTDKSVKIHAFTLSESIVGDTDPVLSFGPQKAAAVLGVNHWKVLLTGSVYTVPDRVGGRESFTFADADGSEVSLLTVRSFLPVNCTRVDCQWREQIIGTLTLDGVAHVLQCSKTVF
jgi:hypothetical protein